MIVKAWKARFNPSELHILDCMNRGLQTADMATELEISETTVLIYKRNIYKLLEVHTSTEAVAEALCHGILSWGDHTRSGLSNETEYAPT